MAFNNDAKLTYGGTVTLLSAKSANGTSDYVEVVPDGTRGYPTKFTVQHSQTGTPTAYTVTLQGSVDGALFSDMGADSTAAGNIFCVADKPVRYIQAVLSNLTGGSSPKITVKVWGV